MLLAQERNWLVVPYLLYTHPSKSSTFHGLLKLPCLYDKCGYTFSLIIIQSRLYRREFVLWISPSVIAYREIFTFSTKMGNKWLQKTRERLTKYTGSKLMHFYHEYRLRWFPSCNPRVNTICRHFCAVFDHPDPWRRGRIISVWQLSLPTRQIMNGGVYLKISQAWRL